ncbi:unnamed protein product [Allacma fusca]|uniref:Uncharacterized protein n=1 Tax=Allacma fusca TaxID=39272 RepID=A0A8J2PB48_9HEXA|nr:unnamed protein product [Allacma fusca]
MSTKYFPILTLFVLALAYEVSLTVIDQQKVCNHVEKYNTTVTVSEQKPVRVREFVWCLAVPPRCSRYITKIKTIQRNQSIEKTRSKAVCCKGFEETPDKKKCTPICSQGCVHGRCEAPDTCVCIENFGGPDCSSTCPEGKWGENCANTCQCIGEGSKCDVQTGKCTCGPGWQGDHCDQECPTDFYGQDCKEECRCKHGGTCHHVSGKCLCAAGWQGPLCEDPCPKGTHGNECSSKCNCQNGGSCHHATGKCHCLPGWRGEVCANPCPLGKWGAQCKQPCDCYNGGFCDPVNGNCNCLPGFTGEHCHLECQSGTWGDNCTKTCLCQNDAHCNAVNGTCTCEAGWTGKLCDEGSCTTGFYGPECQCKCTCNATNTQICHSRDGKCVCKPGWQGRDCTRPCSFNKWGAECLQVCECENGASCDPITGKCICATGYTGDKCEKFCPEGTYGNACEHTCSCKHASHCIPQTGQCICEKGWTGQQCDKECDEGFYDVDCKKKCDCKNNGVCNHISGECSCLPGFHGLKCEQTCPAMMFGLNCKSNCTCNKANTQRCDPVDGNCKCIGHWRGAECDSSCEKGMWGEKCENTCECGDGDCDQRSGICRCPPGKTGAKCEVACQDGTFGLDCAQKCPLCKNGSTCDPEKGHCICDPSYTGFFCSSPCPQGFYGEDCKEKCRCKNSGDCDPKTGKCRCLPGWYGDICSQPCPQGKYGFHCTQNCQCEHGDTCRSSDGECRCRSGWTGPRCSQSCPEGTYGDHCMKACQCPSDDYWCDPVNGCVIRESLDEFNNQIPLHGEDLETTFSCFRPAPPINSPESITETKEADGETGKYIGIVTSIFFILLILACIVVVYYRRKRQPKEDGVATYITNPTGNRPGYDNPMYNYQPSRTVVPVETLNNQKPNISSLKNNLTKQYRSKYDDDDFSSRGAASSHGYHNPMDQKNRDADATNGNLANNIYTSIENINENNDFSDHHYAEINQKKGRGYPEDTYDRLDYSRASSTVNPQYTQMSTVPRRGHGMTSSRASSTGEPSSVEVEDIAVTILVSTFASNGSSYDGVSPIADRTLEDLLEKYANIDQQNFWHPNSFNTGLQSREVIKISSVTKQSIPGVYKQWKTAHLGPSTVFAGLITNGIVLLDEYFNEIAFINASEELVALTVFSVWDDYRSMSELVIIVATVKASLHSYSFANSTVTHLGSWPLHHPVKSLELCTVDLMKKIIVVPQDPRGSVDIYNFKVDGNSSQLWFFQSLKLDRRTCLVVHDADSTCSIAYAAEKSIGLITYDPYARIFHEQSFQNVSSPCKQLTSFSLAYSQYLAYVPNGSNHTVQFFTDTGKGQLYQNSLPIQALEVIPLPGSDNREDILLVKTPDNFTKLYSYDGYGKLFKETFSCTEAICSLGENLSNGASTLANGTTTVFLAPTQKNKTEAIVLLIQSIIEDYPSPLFERARQQYNEFQSLTDLFKRFQQTVMATRTALDDALDRYGSNIITGNWSIRELSSYNVMMSDDHTSSNNPQHQKEVFEANFGTIEFNETPLRYEDFFLPDVATQTELDRFNKLVYQAKLDAHQTIPLESSEVIEVTEPQHIEANVQSSVIDSQNLHIRSINDVDRPQEFFNGLAQSGSPSGIHTNRSINFQGNVRVNNINTNFINGIPVQLMAFSSANNEFNTSIVVQNETYADSNVTAYTVSGLRIPEDILLASNLKGVNFTGTLTAKIGAFIESLVGGIRIDKRLEEGILLVDADQTISSSIEFDTVVLRNLSNIKYLNGRKLSEVIESIVLRNHEGLIRGSKTIWYPNVTANSLTIRDALNFIPFPDGYVFKGETDIITYGTKSFADITADKVTVDGYIDGIKTDQIVRLDSSSRPNKHANWTLYGPCTFEGDIHVTGSVGGIPVSQWEREDLSNFTSNNYLYQPNRQIVIENPVIVEELNVEHKVNGETYNETFGDILTCIQNQPMVVKGLTTFQNGVKLGETEVRTNAVNGQHLQNFLSRHKEQNITKNFVFNQPVDFSELVALGPIDGIWLNEALKDIIFLNHINESSQLTFDSLRTESDVTIFGPINDFKYFGSDVAVTRGRVNQTFENALFVNHLKAKNLYADKFYTAGTINGLNIDKWYQDRVTLSQDRTWTHPVEITGEAIFERNIHSKTINGESLLFLEKGVLRTNGELQTFSSPVVINGLVLARGPVRIQELLNGYSLTEIIRDSIPTDSNFLESITTAWKLENAVFNKLTVKGKTCGVDLVQLDLDSVRKNSSNVHFQGSTTFTQDVQVLGKLRTDLVNTGNMNDSFFTLNTAQEIQGNFNWKNDVQVDGILNVGGTINNISLEDFQHLYSFYNGIHHINSSVEFDDTFEAKHLEIEGFIQSRKLDRFLSSIVWLDSPTKQNVHGDLKFTQPFISESNIECDTLNGIDVSELARQLVLKNRGFVFNEQVCFTKPLQTGTLFVESGNVETTTGIVGGVNIEDLKTNSIPVNSVSPLSIDEMFFEDVSINGGLEGVSYVNGIPIQDLLTRNTPQNMTSLKVTHLRVLQKNIDIKGLFGGVNINDVHEDTVLVTNQAGFISGAKSFTGTVNILGNLKTDGKITSSLVMMNGTNVIKSPTVFEDDVIVTVNMILLGKWNNYTLSDMQQHGVSKYGDEVIKTRWNFPRGLILKNETASYGLIDGINMTSVEQESRKKVYDMEHSLSSEYTEFNQVCHTYQRLYNQTERSPLKLQSFDEQQVIFTKQKVTNMLTVEVGASLFLLVTSDTCRVYVYKWSTQKEEFHEFGLALVGESIDKWVRSSSNKTVIIVFSTASSKCGEDAEVGLYFTIPNAGGNFTAKKLISSGSVVDFKLVSDKMQGILLFVVYSETPEAVVVYSWNNSNYNFVLESSLNISTFIRTLDVTKLRNGDVEILLQTVFRVSIAVYSSSQKSLKEIGHADFYGSSKSMALFRADTSLYALVSTRETSKKAIKPDCNLQLFLATRGELQFLQKLTIYDLVSMEVVRVGNQVYVLVLTKPVGLYIYKFMGLSGLQTVSVHPLKFHHGEHLTSFQVTPWHYDTPLPFVLISNGYQAFTSGFDSEISKKSRPDGPTNENIYCIRVDRRCKNSRKN